MAPQKWLVETLEEKESTCHSREEWHSHKANKIASMLYPGMREDVGYKLPDHHHVTLLMERFFQLE